MVLSCLLCTPAFAAADQPATDIRIYTAAYCGECLKAKAYMQARRIDFVEYDVQKNSDFLRDFYAQGGKGIPYLIVKGRAMHGFDVAEFEHLRSNTEFKQ